VELVPLAGVDGAGVTVGVTTRWGGVSTGPYESLNLSFAVSDDPEAVTENRRRLADGFGADLGEFVFARQVHGTGVAVVAEQDRGRGAYGPADAIVDCDALVTATSEVVLAILTADCAPIVLHDPVAQVLACVHSGWRGTAARVAAETIKVMATLGADPARTKAGIGPVIDPTTYQVGRDVYDAFGGRFARPDPAAPGRWLFDLRAANRQVLIDAGLAEQNIHVTGIATGGDFFSDRVRRPCGRLALVARLTPQIRPGAIA
jgi:polyphenol oxidase